MKEKYAMDLGGQKSTTKHNNEPKVNGRTEGGKGDKVGEWGGARGKGESVVFMAIEFS